MYRSTTPTIILHVKNEEIELSEFKTCHVTLKSEQDICSLLITKPEINVEEKTISFELSQEDTSKFYKGIVKLQVKTLLKSGRVIASNIIKINLKEILEEEFL